MLFNSLLQKIFYNEDSFGKDSFKKSIDGITSSQWNFLFSQYLNSSNEQTPLPEDVSNNFILICPNEKEAEATYDQLKNISTHHSVFYLPPMDSSPYQGVIQSDQFLKQRFKVLTNLRLNKKNIIVCPVESFTLTNPQTKFFDDSLIEINISDILAPRDLAIKLQAIGYFYSHTIEEPGSFSNKGEIFDIFPINSNPYRLLYFDDMIEEILEVDFETKKSVSNKNNIIEKITIGPSPAMVRNKVFVNQFRENIPQPAANQRARFESRKVILNNLSDENIFDGYSQFFPAFFKEKSKLTDFLEHATLVFTNSNDIYQSFDTHIESLKEECTREFHDINSDVLSPSPENYHYDLKDITSGQLIETNFFRSNVFDEDLSHSLNISFKTFDEFCSQFNEANFAGQSKHEFIKWFFNLLKEQFENSGNIIFATKHESTQRELRKLLENYDLLLKLKDRISFANISLEKGFYYENEKTLVVSESDLFARKVKKTKAVTKKPIDLFAEQFASLKIGDYIIHNSHGIGKYLGLESMEFGGVQTDYLILEYSSKDKVYLPVYKLNQIQKHADATASSKVDSLRTNKFKALKDRAKKSIKKLAFDLLKLQAERATQKAYAFSPPDDLYNEFELSFPFEETPDQSSAIQDVLESMQKSLPMDHLVCGDVGFGKTEVAMRAAFKAVEDKKQIAILVPTTILALQHFNSFKKRFDKFPVNIEFLSRFKTAKESKEILAKLPTGEIDIIIGTHKLLSDKIKYKDLGLVVVDEEQRFGVSHKEKLKLLKSTVDFLTLTATPIPRTMQLAFLGIRELSLIKTAPPRRQSIKTYIIKEDEHTLQAAIKRELQRGGQVFIVHNKVSDIEQYTAFIKELVPEAKIVFAHGQLPERELESRMEQFFKGTYNVLIATTIIESGLDIPNANTLIVDRADTFGLAQLHQLRGRIGRSDKKAYAYFMIPKLRVVSEIAQKRLKAMQTYADMGAGFHIASADLEIRGAGDILGAQQSGHIESIGLELYTELLKEAIAELKGEKQIINSDVEIITPFPAYIPNNYISHSAERLKQYKRLSNLKNIDEVQEIKDEFQDIYGAHPKELENLFSILEARIILRHCGMIQLSVVSNLLIFKFDQTILDTNPELREKIVSNFLHSPKKYSFSPDFKITYTHKEEISPTILVGLSREIAQKIDPC